MLRFMMALTLIVSLGYADMAAGTTQIICGQNQWAQALAPNVQACYKVTTSRVLKLHSSEWVYSVPKEEVQ